MFRKLLILLVLTFCFPILSESNAQTLLKNNEIPEDLIITITRTGQYGDNIMVIKANGDLLFKENGISVRQRIETSVNKNERPVILNEQSKPVLKTISTETKIEKNRIKSLIAEFEKIQFFRFGDNYPIESNEIKLPYRRHLPTEVISIQINGKKKSVSNDRGNSGIRTEMLSDLADKIRETIYGIYQ